MLPYQNPQGEIPAGFKVFKERMERPVKTLQHRAVRNLDLFLTVSLFGILSFLFLFLVFGEKAALWLAMDHNFDWQFSDYFRHVVYASDLRQLYFNTNDASFPPLAYLFYHLVYRLHPLELPVTLESWQILGRDPFHLFVFLIRTSLLMFFLYPVLKRFLRASDRNTALLWCCIVFSTPFLAGAVERGNSVLLVVLLLLSALSCMGDPSPKVRELALLLFSLAACIKIYPAIFILLYVKEKRWREAARFVLYSALLFLLPFVFAGGFEGFVQYLRVLLSLGNTSYTRWTDVKSFFLAIMQQLGSDPSNLLTGVGKGLSFAVLFAMLFSFFRTHCRYREIMLLSGICSVFVSNSYRYTACYMAIALLAFLKEQNANGKLYAVLFGFIFTIPFFAYFGNLNPDFFLFVPIYLLLLICMVDIQKEKAGVA